VRGARILAAEDNFGLQIRGSEKNAKRRPFNTPFLGADVHLFAGIYFCVYIYTYIYMVYMLYIYIWYILYMVYMVFMLSLSLQKDINIEKSSHHQKRRGAASEGIRLSGTSRAMAAMVSAMCGKKW
jgi:Ca2+/Na+ antiporter